MAEARTGHAAPPLLVRTDGDTRRLPSGPAYVIGRNPAADVAVSDARVSWQHAVLRVDDGRWVLEDQGSSNGTFVASGGRITRLEITGPCAVWLSHPGDGPVLRLEPEPDPAPGSSTAPSRPAGRAPGPYAGDPAGADPREGTGRPGPYLKGRYPSGVRVGETFSVMVGIVRDAPGSDPLEYPPAGARWQDVIVALDAPGGEFLSSPRDVIHVPPGADSEPVRFELRATSAGPLHITVRTWAGPTYLGELAIEVAAARYRIRRAGQRDTVALIDLR
ncbi:MAG TPA: FHA domain-containing protein [Trebonia sp.]